MAQDDMFVVMYKIIAYLYDCMKKGDKPDIKEYGFAAMGVTEPYWNKVMKQLVDHELIDGVSVIATGSGNLIVTPVNPAVTMEGVQFAQENSMMAKAAKFLRDAKASIPFI